MEQPARVAEMPVGDERKEVARALAAQHAAAQHDEPGMLEHPHLAPVFALVRGSRPLEGQRLRLVDRTPATLNHEVGQREVMPETGVDLGVIRPA